LIVAMAALVVAMSGAAIALPGKGTVSTNDIKKGAITKKLIAKAAVGSRQIIGKSIKGNRLKDKAVRAKQVADATITSKQVADDGLDSSNLSDLEIAGKLTKVTATDGADFATARAAAPETALFAKGELAIYGKCVHNTTTDATRAEAYARTTTDGALLDGVDNLPNNDAVLLDTATPETDRELAVQAVTAANAADFSQSTGALASLDGTSLRPLTSLGVKQGALAGGNGVFGDGTVCLFGLDVTG
jgi:hypothetical protein